MIFMVYTANTLKTERVLLDKSKVQRHEVPLPEELEFQLVSGRGIYIKLPGFREYGAGPLKSWRSGETEREFPELVERFRRGEYMLHLYNNGELEVEQDSRIIYRHSITRARFEKEVTVRTKLSESD